MNQAKLEETEQLISQLCNRFTHIFEQIKEIKECRVDLEEENSNLEAMIKEETSKFEEGANAMEKATSQLQSQNQELQEGEQASANRKADEIQQDLDEKKKILDVSHLKLKEVTGQLQQELSVKQGLESQLATLEDNLGSIKSKIQEHQEMSSNVENNLSEINQKNEELAEKIKNLMFQIDNNEMEVKRSLEEKCQKEDEYKANLKDYRELLNQTANYQKKTKETEKIVRKLSEELRSKLKRLEILVKNKMKLEGRLYKLESVKQDFEQVSQANQMLEDENYQLRSKLELYVEPERQENPNVDRSYSSIRGTLKRQSQPQQPQKETDLYKKVKHHVLQSQYLEQLMKDMQDKDNEIFKNKKRIQEINQSIEQSKVALIEKRQEKDRLIDKLEIMKNSTQELGKKYEAMCFEYGLQPYQVDTNLNYQTETLQSQTPQIHQNTNSTAKKLQFSQQSTPQRSASALKTLE